jgi:4-amino-4-deoxy-L-arabinose transferase-like glycosyltransferase
MKNLLLLLGVCLFSFFLLTYRITSVPPGINGDEVGIGHNAFLISRNLTDENDNFLPLFIFAKTSDWKQPVTVYSTALIFRLFGPSLMALRVTSVLLVIASVIIFYFLAREIFNLKFFLVGSLILITIPIIMIQSHLALENIAVLPFVFFWLLMLAKYEKAKKSIYLLLSGVSLGVGIFSYLGMRLIVPVLSLITLIYLRNNIKRGIYFILGVLPFFVLLFIANFYYPGAVIGHYSSSTPSVNEFLLRYISSFDLSFLFLKGDVTPFHSTGKVGMFLIATLPIFLIGVWKIIKDKKPFELLVLSSFFLAPIFFGFVPDVYRASRLLALIPFYVIISTLGFFAVSKKYRLVIFALVVINYLFFAKDYWFNYSERVKNEFSQNMSYYNYNFTKK